MNKYRAVFIILGWALCGWMGQGSVMAEEAQAPAEPPAPVRVPASLYDRLGGEKAITMVVDDFVKRTSANPKVNFTRKGKTRSWEASAENVAKLKKHLAQFICMATGGPQAYEGRGMDEAHQGLEITDEEFDALAADLKASLEALGVPAQEQQELMTVAGTTRGAIVQKKAPVVE